MNALVCHGSEKFASEAMAMQIVKSLSDGTARVTNAVPCGGGVTTQVLLGQVKPGDIVAIVGGGSIGLAALLRSQLNSPSKIIVIDVDESRLEKAKRSGATAVINNTNGRAIERVMALTKNRGVDVAIDAIGIPLSFNLCQAIVAMGGCISNISSQGKPIPLKLAKLSDRNITVTSRLAHAITTSLPLKLVMSAKAQPKVPSTLHFSLMDVAKAYDSFDASQEECESEFDDSNELGEVASF